MKPRIARTVGFVLILGATVIGDDGPSPKLLYDQHRWFELRDAIRGRPASPLYEGAVAAAFNDRGKAEENLARTIKLQPKSADAEDAHEILANVYIRFGQYKDAVRQLDEALTIKPQNEEAKNARALFAAWSRHPNQYIERFKAGRIQADVSEHGGVKLPVSIHGKTVHWVLDTAANFSVMSDSEAQSLGVSIDESNAAIKDSAGGTTKMRTAVVDDLVIGSTHLRNVAFLILPDAQQPMRDLPPGERGLIGIQVPIALGAIDWRSDGAFQFGDVSKSRGSEKNLSFDDLNPVVRGGVESWIASWTAATLQARSCGDDLRRISTFS